MKRGITINMNKLLRALAVVALAAAVSAPCAKTRWSALQLVPNADLLAEGRFMADIDFLWDAGQDEMDFSLHGTTQRLHFGLTEWVNFDVGYAGGFTMGLKANLVKETEASWLPSIALGMQNLFTSRDAEIFGAGKDFPKNEFYLAGAKTSEWAKLRIHAGFMSAATYTNGEDRFNPFVGLEKYFGQRLYMTLEAQRRDEELLLSVFAACRFATDRLEVNVGLIDAPGVGRSKSPDTKIINPVLRAGVRVYLGGNGYNTFDGIAGVEDRLDRYRDTINTLDKRLDSLNAELRFTMQQVHALSEVSDDRREERARVVEDLTRIRNMYDQEPFDPEIVRSAVERFLDRKDINLPHMRVIITDPNVSVRIRTLAITLMGDMGDNASADIMISMLDRFEEPQLKTEIIIALGKMRETRAKQMIGKLRNDQDKGVAFAANEVYNRLFGNEDGTAETPERDLTPWPTGNDPTENRVPEQRIGR